LPVEYDARWITYVHTSKYNLLNTAVDDIDETAFDLELLRQQVHKGLFIVNWLGKCNQLICGGDVILAKGHPDLLVIASV